ncbi:hypothetical protein BVRB_7g159420 [Beta vulgaris subsp. vulgaris]|nr:hypothetical protein BVRB_7g159420 [Beta vulgaris subsp. vulgaris]
MHPNYAACSKGKRQSPININTNDVVANKTMKPLSRKYHIYNATLCTDGYDTEVAFNGRGELIIDGRTYKLKQMHWHTPSEHRLNGVQYPAELHQVHATDDGNRAVVAILFEYGKPDPVLTMLKPQLNELAKEPCQGGLERQVAIPWFGSSFLKKRPRKYYRYPGSLTTPPCDENVIWSVLTKVESITKDQIEALKAPLCEANKIKNARPTQPLNGRKVQKYDGK